MAFTFPPRGWLLCQGQLLAIQSNTALFALLGTQYGGDGRTTFALPDLRGRTHVGVGQGAGLSQYSQGAVTGTESVTLQSTEMPAHTHTVNPATMPVSSAPGSQTSPVNTYFAQAAGTPTPMQYGADTGGNMAADAVSGNSGLTGGGLPHENRMPFLALEYCIATQGVFPQRQ